jgi:hypothetical protein
MRINIAPQNQQNRLGDRTDCLSHCQRPIQLNLPSVSLLMQASLKMHLPAVHCQYFTRNVATCSACEKNGGPLEVIGTTPSASRDTFEDAGRTLLVVDQSIIHVCVDVSWGNLISTSATTTTKELITAKELAYSVDINASTRPLVRQRLGQLRNTSLGCCVSRHIQAALERHQRRDVDDGAPVRRILARQPC